MPISNKNGGCGCTSKLTGGAKATKTVKTVKAAKSVKPAKSAKSAKTAKPAKKTGGSVASNSVTQLLNSNTYKQMNNTATNRLSSCATGGSVASNSVTQLLNANTYKQMNNTATNRLSSCAGGTGGSKAKCQKCKKVHGGNTIRSQPAPAFAYGGSFIPQNMSEFKNSNAYSLKNKRGGSSAPVTIGLDYSVIPTIGSQYGEYVDRSTSSDLLKYMANTSPSVSIPMIKNVSATLGGVTDHITPFNYGNSKIISSGGAKKTKVKK
jgi:hypothetical protein